MGMEVIKSQNGTVEPHALAPEEIKQLSQEQKLMTVGMGVNQQYDIVRVNSIGEYYWKNHDDEIYRHLDKHQLEMWALNFWLETFGGFTPKSLTDSCEMVKLLTRKEVNNLSLDCIMISNKLFWDREHGEVSRSATGPVFYQLFDTKTLTKGMVKIPPFTEEQEEIFMSRYEQVKAELQRGEEVERYEFLKTWADGSHDVYMDLHRAHAYMFLKKKPLGSYMLIGLKRNGKSSYIKLTKSIVGGENTSDVQLTQLGDPHVTHTLMHSMVNAPDEEEDKAVKAQGFFKILADHGTLSLPVMRSNVPVKLDCDFMSFFPMNHTPEWTGSGAAACMERSLIIPFNADLSKFDKVSNDFAQETFTPNVMADYLGSVFAYAWWYHRHDFEFSETMHREQGVLEQDIDSCLTYYKHFTKYFDGFEAFKTVYTDYQYWCQAQDVKINTRKELKFVFRNMANTKVSYRYKDQVRTVYRVARPNYQPMMNDFWCKEVSGIDSLHDKGWSVIDQLDFYYEQKELK